MRYSNWHVTAMFCMNAVLRSEDGRSASEACCCMILMLWAQLSVAACHGQGLPRPGLSQS